ncbi:Oligoxyloglucan reducing end-specific cellobiohydrolase [Laetiporus sulphureus 93-53]|uniref:Vacuolar protein sorting/targeting protein 10 n=1 Tax=Laetiporus sulphureus 93-53 TaxID=1314785 RepID=A0A165BG81_9APHY|nr:Oligoxyloglucan reducing end-specific cellobiohydrolase [Laetiporus sulphureus 93-53]KZT00997.1 Oligoxyloglucan reducing end-specific cellobiohydrolase [Laetiporus sulphureus 93-53]
MILHMTALLFWYACLMPLLLVVRAQQPEHSVTAFQNLPSRLFFFDDTTTAIYHDAVNGDVFVSPDEGKTWNKANGIPEGQASMVIEHPFDNSYAFVLTRGTTHYRTEDRGRTWRRFEMPIQPALVGKPLSFHSDPKKYGYILYQGTSCERSTGWGSICHDETYYTKEAFSDEPQLLLAETSRCQFAHSSKDFKHDAHPDLIYCVAFDTTTTSGAHALSSSRLFSSTDFFKNENKIEDLGIGKNAKGVMAFAIVSKFAVVALRDLSPGNNGEMLLYVSVDTKTWAKARFPHASSARLRENGYTIVESTTHSLAVDVMLQDQTTIGTLFVSNSNGTFFVESLKDTNRNEMGYVDFEDLYGIEGVGMANVVANAEEVEGRGATKQLQTKITFDDGRSWSRLTPPSEDSEGRGIWCNPNNADCSLHLHSVTVPHNFGRVFSSPAPGFVMGVGSIGAYLKPYDECDTFLSTDAGVTWTMVRMGAHKYEFGDQGSIMVVVDDEDATDSVSYSSDLGRTWRTLNFGVKLRARILTTVPDSTSQKFMLVGQVAKDDAQSNQGRYAVVFLDFLPMRSRKCGEDDYERWYARSLTHECLMGHKQWYKRRKPDADCYVGEKFADPVEHEEDCPCTDEDYECDYNFVREGNVCVPVGPEPIPAGVCPPDQQDQTYRGSSGYRLIPGNTCDRSRGVRKDDPVEKPCSNAQPAEGQIIHQTFEFQAPVVQFAYFKDSTTILVRLSDNTIWQSSNEGYTWRQIVPEERFVAFYHHKFTNDRAYLITPTNRHYYTTDTGRTWKTMNVPNPPNNFGLPILHFHPTKSDYLIWTGSEGCSGFGENCHVEASYSRNNGEKWTLIEKYVRNCAWARDAELLVDPNQIICEVYKNKEGSQRFFSMENPLQLIGGTGFFSEQTKLFDHVVGFAKFSEFLIVAEYQTQKQALDLQVSLDGRKFASGLFPPNMRPDQHAYTILESSTKAVFLHVTTSELPGLYWGHILKSNSNGTYYGLSIENVNRNEAGYVDFEKMIGLDGIALINVVSNPQEAIISGRKKLQTRITHNDGGTWKRLVPPPTDSLNHDYECDSASCALHIHGYTERYDARATYSTPSVPGLLMAVGNVGTSLAEYTESDTFLSRDAGHTWEEVHKDAHLWEFGDSGSILIMANDEEPTDHVLFSTDEGLNWREYRFTDEKIRVKEIVTVPSDTSRRFILMGYYPRSPVVHVAVHIDFSSLTRKQCVLSIENPGNDDFELWSPSEQRNELCLFGRQTLYHRRVRDANCVVGNQPKATEKVVKNCECDNSDFECEFNYYRDESGVCVLVPGTQPLPDDDSCRNGEDHWYERTEYRKIPYSTCDGGKRLDRGDKHLCPGIKGHSGWFWFTVLMVPFAFAGLFGWWFYRKHGLARGTIRLPGGESGPRYVSNSSALDTLASVPWYLMGLAGIAWGAIISRFGDMTAGMRNRSGYRSVPVDEDAQILRFEDEE